MFDDPLNGPEVLTILLYILFITRITWLWHRAYVAFHTSWVTGHWYICIDSALNGVKYFYIYSWSWELAVNHVMLSSSNSQVKFFASNVPFPLRRGIPSWVNYPGFSKYRSNLMDHARHEPKPRRIIQGPFVLHPVWRIKCMLCINYTNGPDIFKTLSLMEKDDIGIITFVRRSFYAETFRII